MSIRVKLFVFVLLGCVLPLLVVFAVSFHLQRSNVQATVESTLSANAVQTLSTLNGQIIEARRSLDNFSRLGVMTRVETADAFDLLQMDLNQFVNANPMFAEICALDDKGDVIAATNPAQQGENLSSSEFFQNAMQGELTITDPKFSDSANGYVSMQYMPIRTTTDEIVGVLVGALSWQYLRSTLSDVPVLGKLQSKNRILTLRSTSNNALLYQTLDSKLSMNSVTAEATGKPVEITNNGVKSVSIIVTPSSKNQYSENNLALQFLVDHATAYKPIHRLTKFYTWAGLLVLGLVGIMWWMLSRSLGSRITRLAQGAKELSKGNFYYRLDHHNELDELGQLTQSFEVMRRTIQNNEKTLVSKSEAAEQTAKLKGEFLANMSHEVRTPINGVLGMTELLLQTELDIDQKRYASTILRSGQSLLSVINDILDFSKIEAGKLDLDTGPFDLRETMEDVTEMLAESAHRKGLELNLEMPPELHLAYEGDSSRIRQILVNLISNGIKFTSEGEVKVKVSCKYCKDGETTNLRIDVTDTGIGIPEDSIGRVFNEFEQADGTTTREYGGTGLGLAISKQLANLMGGRIGVNSKAGKGSTFWFTSKVVRLPQTVQHRWTAKDTLVNRNFLVVDDNKTNRDILGDQLRHWGANPTIVEGPHEALAAIEQAIEDDTIFDVAIVDQQMPKMMGSELINTIKSRWSTLATDFIVLSSVNNQREADPNNLQAKHTHITKPVRQQDLYNCLAAALGDESAMAASIKTDKIDKTTLSGDVLLVEDNPVNQDMMLEMLRLLGIQAELAENGQEAVDRLTEKRFDLVFMDCQMPVMDGFEATAEIRRHEAQSDDPYRQVIVALTANALEGDRERCLNAGMSDYLSKPISSAQLRQCLTSWLIENDKDNLQSSKAEQRDNIEMDNKPLENESYSFQNTDILDMSVYQEVLDMTKSASEGFYDRLLVKYIDNADIDLASLQEAIAGGAADTVRASAHRLKSSSGNWGGVRVAELCQALENEGKAEQLSNAPALLEQLRQEVSSLINRLGENASDDYQRAA